MVIAEMSRTLKGLCNLEAVTAAGEKLHSCKSLYSWLSFYEFSDFRSLLVRSIYGSFAPVTASECSFQGLPKASLNRIWNWRESAARYVLTYLSM